MNRKRKFGGKTITYGDKIFARITKNGKTIYNFVSERVASMTEFLMEIRKAMKGIKGLVVLHIRNYNQGWGEERPLMLYTTDSNRKSQKFFPWEIVGNLS